MINAIWDEGFKRSYRKKIRRFPYLKKRFWEKLEIFLEEPHASHLRTHKLSGKLSSQWAFTLMLQKFRRLQIRGVKGEAVYAYC